MKRAVLALFNILIIFFITSCDKSEYRKQDGVVWHTTYHIIYKSDQNYQDSIIRVLEEVDKSLNFFNESSLLSKLNNGNSIKADSHLLKVYICSQEINQVSNGAFDPTLGPLIDAWGFGRDHKATNDTCKIDSLLAFVGFNKTTLKDDMIYKNDSRTEFNFSAVAKGYGCDAIAEMFNRNGVVNYLIEIGGEIRANGKSARGDCWNISIDKPIFENDNIIHDSQVTLPLCNGGLATSGNYRNFHESAGERFGHTISVKTGRPIQTEILSATVIAPTAMLADALATSFMAMPMNDAKTLADSLHHSDGIRVLFITTSGVWEPGKIDQ